MEKKKIIKIIILVVAVIAVLFLLWNYLLYPIQAFKHNEKLLSDAGKRYFEINSRNLPKEEGRVSTVSLEVLIKQKYLDELKIKKSYCDIKKSNVKMRIESGANSYYTHLQCGSRHSNIDYNGPVITLNGTKKMTINKGDTYTEPGVLSVKDKTDGEIKKDEVIIKGKVNPNKIGTYKVTYTVSDSLDNETVVTREVEVIENLTTIVKKATKETNGYYQGLYSDNYLTFNNILFRIVRVNSDGTVTIVSNSPLANIDYDSNKNRFDGSSMDEWLNDYFYPLLNDKSKKLIVSSKWCDDVVTEVNKTTCDRYSSKKNIGILSLEDYNNSLDSKKESYLQIMARTWYNNFDSNNKVWSVKSNTMESYKDNVLLNIKPAITLTKNIRIKSGDGTIESPYKIGTETYAKRNMKVNKLDIGTSIEYSGYSFIVAGKEKDGTTKVIMAYPLITDTANNEISYDTESPIKIYNPKEKGNIAYQINNVLVNYIDTNYFVKKEYSVPVYDKFVTYKGKHDNKKYTSKLMIPSAFEAFSASINNTQRAYWLIDGSKEEENKTMIDMDGTTAFYYKETGRKAGVKIKAYLSKDTYVKSGNCVTSECNISK